MRKFMRAPTGPIPLCLHEIVGIAAVCICVVAIAVLAIRENSARAKEVPYPIPPPPEVGTQYTEADNAKLTLRRAQVDWADARGYHSPEAMEWAVALDIYMGDKPDPSTELMNQIIHVNQRYRIVSNEAEKETDEIQKPLRVRDAERLRTQRDNLLSRLAVELPDRSKWSLERAREFMAAAGYPQEVKAEKETKQ